MDGKVVFVLLLSSLCVCWTAPVLEDETLRLELASVVFRHGDRSPVHTFPTDPYSESDWPQGYGQLSIAGMRQQHHLGELLKARYVVPGGCDGLICDNYTRIQVRIRATDVDRTLMSAESQLSSFFIPGPDQMFNDSLPWQPIPIHTIPVIQDSLLRPLDNCPIFDSLMASDMETMPEYKAMEEKYKDFFANLSTYSGMPVNLSNVWVIQDTLKIETDSPDHTPPSWATDDVQETLQTISDYTMNFMFNTVKKQRLSSGTWVGKILGDMEGKANPGTNQTLKDMKLFLYSAHDTTVSAMTNALNVSNGKQPGYTTAFAVELYSNTTGFYVQMFRRDGPDSDTFNSLNISYCTNPTICTLQEFQQYVQQLIPSDLAEECKVVTTPNTTTTKTTPTTPTAGPDLQQQNKDLRITVIGLGSALGVVLLLTLVLLVLLISVCRKKNAKAQRLYSALAADT